MSRPRWRRERLFIFYTFFLLVIQNQLQLAENSKGSIESRLEEAVLDLIPEDVREMNDKRRLMHWDKRKRKYVQITVGELKSGNKKQKTESGKKMKEHKQGELYKKWQEKNNKRIAREGGDEVCIAFFNFLLPRAQTHMRICYLSGSVRR